LVGTHCLQRLLASEVYDSVTVLVRRALPLADPKLTQIVADFDRLEEGAASVAAEDVYCCLGTTIKKAGSQEAFRRVDFDYPLELARFSKTRGARRFLMVSALGADARSSVFYNRVKGEVEQAVRELAIEKSYFFRPSLLLGARVEFRLGERVAMAAATLIAPVLVGGLTRYRPIQADAVAAAMVHAARLDLPAGVIESEEIARLGALVG
jgi:uncharacterized protein YbjT (DUF2867 family)